jgi:hypothetical protein
VLARIGLGDDDVDLARLELRAQGGQLLVVELVLGREGLEYGLLDRAALLEVVQDGVDSSRKRRTQCRSLLPYK